MRSTSPPHEQPLVSVIVPTLNRGYCVAAAIASAQRQTYSNLEILVVDDGSTDDTREIVVELASADDRVKYLHKENGGVAAARNYAIRNAAGAYFAFLDSDDAWKPWKIELQLACLRRCPQAGMIWTDMEAIDGSGRVLSARYLREMYHAYSVFRTEELFAHSEPLETVADDHHAHFAGCDLYHGEIFSAMITGNLVHTSTVLISRQRLEEAGVFPEHMRQGGEDYHFHLMTCRAGQVAFADVATIEYRVGASDQITETASTIHFARAYLQTISGVLERDRSRITLSRKQIERILARAHGWLGEEAAEIGERAEARTHLLASFRYQVLQPRVLARLVAVCLPAVAEAFLFDLYRGAKASLAGSVGGD